MADADLPLFAIPRILSPQRSSLSRIIDFLVLGFSENYLMSLL
jgi:hypothetical protein